GRHAGQPPAHAAGPGDGDAAGGHAAGRAVDGALRRPQGPPRPRVPRPVTPAVHLTPEQRVFVLERHVATLATLRPDGTPHVVPIAFTWDPERGEAWMTTEDGSVKVRNVEAALAAGRPARGALCQVAGGRWLTLEGT